MQATTASEAIISTRDLVKRYGQSIAVDGVDLDVMPREIFGILGPNGAGKTTTLEMLEGLQTPDEGTATLAGYDVVHDIDDIRRIIGVQLQTTALFDHLTVSEIIELFAGLYGVERTSKRIESLLAMVHLEEKRNSRVDQLSGGQQQRLSIALGLVNDPVVAFLDEPTTGLDPGARRNVWDTIREMRDRGTTVVLTTHYMEEAEVLCDRVAVMDYGRIIALDTPRGLIRGLNAAARIEAHVAAGDLQLSDLEALPGVLTVELNDGQIVLSSTNVQHSLSALLQQTGLAEIELVDLRSTHATLEDVFLELTGRSYSADAEPEAPEPSATRRWPRSRRRE